MIADFFEEVYKDKKEKPQIYVSPSYRTILTAIPVAMTLNMQMKIEDGLLEHNHGYWTLNDKKSILKEKYGKNIDSKYKSKFKLLKSMIVPHEIGSNFFKSNVSTKI